MMIHQLPPNSHFYKQNCDKHLRKCFFLDLYAWVELLDHGVSVHLIWFWTAIFTGYTSLPICMRVPLCLQPHQLVMCNFSFKTHLICTMWYFIIILIYLILITNEFEHLFMCLKALWGFSVLITCSFTGHIVEELVGWEILLRPSLEDKYNILLNYSCFPTDIFSLFLFLSFIISQNVMHAFVYYWFCNPY